MKEKLTTIKLSGKDYPLKCDNYVLQSIQEKYGTIKEFEYDLMGVHANGMDADGKAKYEETEPSMKAINIGLVEMIQEGMDIERESGKEWPELTEKQILRIVDVPYFKLAGILHNEFKNCFVSKK